MSKSNYRDIKYKKFIRVKDNRPFQVRTNQDGSKFLCTNDLRVLKTLDTVRDFDNRFKEAN